VDEVRGRDAVTAIVSHLVGVIEKSAEGKVQAAAREALDGAVRALFSLTSAPSGTSA